MNKLSFLTFFIIVLSVFTSCKKEINDLGSQLINEDDAIILSFDSLDIKASIHREDSLVTLNSPSAYLGNIYDSEYFGSTGASIYTELRMPSSDVTFGEDATVDSFILSFVVNDYYGDTTTVLDIEVQQMLEQIETSVADVSGEDSILQIYADQQFLVAQNIIASQEVVYQSDVSSTIDIVISNELGQSFLDASSDNFVDNESFQSFFNGLYISSVPQTTAGLLLNIDLLDERSKLTLYYHNSSSDALSYDFQINSNADRMTRWEHDYSVGTIEDVFNQDDIDLAFVQGGVGIRTYLDFSVLKTLKDSNYIIHQAELFLPYLDTDLSELHTSPSKLGLAAVNSEGNLEVLVEDQNAQGVSYFDGNRDEVNQYYKFNIARYVQKLIYENYTSNLALYTPSSIIQPERVVIDNTVSDTSGVRLKLLLSKYE